MYLLAYDYEDSSREEYFVEGEEDLANARYREAINDPYIPYDSIVVLTMCVGIAFNNRPDAKVYTYRTERYLGNRSVIEPYDKNGNRWVDEYGDPVSAYVKTAGYRPAAEVKALAKKLSRANLDVLYTAEDFAVEAKIG